MESLAVARSRCPAAQRRFPSFFLFALLEFRSYVAYAIPANATVFFSSCLRTVLTLSGSNTTISFLTMEIPLLDYFGLIASAYEEIIRAKPRCPICVPAGEGHPSLLPADASCRTACGRGWFVMFADHRLYYFPKHSLRSTRFCVTYPVSIGKLDRNKRRWSTTIH